MKFQHNFLRKLREREREREIRYERVSNSPDYNTQSTYAEFIETQIFIDRVAIVLNAKVT